MTNTEFDIIDELYFVTSFTGLQSQVRLPENELAGELLHLVRRGFVKCFFPDPDSELEFSEADFRENYRAYYYLATKEGLLQHNSR